MRDDSNYINELVRQIEDEKTKTNTLQGYVNKIEPKATYYDIILQCPRTSLNNCENAQYKQQA